MLRIWDYYSKEDTLIVDDCKCGREKNTGKAEKEG